MAIEVNGITLPDIPTEMLDKYPYAYIMNMYFGEDSISCLVMMEKEPIFIPSWMSPDGMGCISASGGFTKGSIAEMVDGAWSFTDDTEEEIELVLPVGEIMEGYGYSVLYTIKPIYIAESLDPETFTIVKSDTVWDLNPNVPVPRLEVGDLSFPPIPSKFFNSYPYATLYSSVSTYNGTVNPANYKLLLSSVAMVGIPNSELDGEYECDFVMAFGSTSCSYTYDATNDTWVDEVENTESAGFMNGTMSTGIGLSYEYTILWSNHNIHVWRETGGTQEDIYFAGEGVKTPIPRYAVEREKLIKLTAYIRKILGLNNTLTLNEAFNALSKANFSLQEKTVTPTEEVQEVVADSGFYGLSKVTVEAVELSEGETLPSAEGVTFGTYEVVNEVGVPTGKSYFNGVLLPDIPEDILKNYTYCWIRKNPPTGYYDLVVNQNIMYYSNGTMAPSISNTNPYYRIPISGSDGYSEWVWYKDTSSSFGVDSDRPMLWSNYDVPNGSATSANIYFKATEPVIEIIKSDIVVNEMLVREDAYAVSGDWLNELSSQVQIFSGNMEPLTTAELLAELSQIHTYQVGNAVSVLDGGWINSNAFGQVTT